MNEQMHRGTKFRVQVLQQHIYKKESRVLHSLLLRLTLLLHLEAIKKNNRKNFHQKLTMSNIELE